MVVVFKFYFIWYLVNRNYNNYNNNIKGEKRIYIFVYRYMTYNN